MIPDPYSPCVRELFADTAHAGDLAGDYERSVCGAAAESARGARIEFVAGAAGSRLEELRFRAFGCPHLIAAAEWVCRGFERGGIDELRAFDVRQCLEALEIPLDKTGRVLLIEDAIQLLLDEAARASRA